MKSTMLLCAIELRLTRSPCERFLAINYFVVNETKSGQPNKRLFSLTFRELNG